MDDFELQVRKGFIESFTGINKAYLDAKKKGDKESCLIWQTSFLNIHVLIYKVLKDKASTFKWHEDFQIWDDMHKQSREDFPISWIEHDRMIKLIQQPTPKDHKQKPKAEAGR